MEPIIKMDPFEENADHECCRELKTSMMNMQYELEKRMADMENTLKKEIKDLQRTLSKATEQISVLMDVKNVVELRKVFPLRTEEDLRDIDMKIAESPSNYLPVFQRILMPEGMIKNIERIMTRDLLMKINFAGSGTKKAFDKYIHLNNILYEATTSNDRNFNDYKKNIRAAFARVKNRVHKTNCIRRKMKLEKDET